MRKIISSLLATLVVSFIAEIASAADLSVRQPTLKAPAVPLAYNWTGFYIGGHVGGAWGDKHWFDASSPPTEDLGVDKVSGVVAGGQLGVNWQISNWLLGIEGQASWSNAKGNHHSGSEDFESKVDWLGTIAGRVGLAFDRVLIYGKGGAAFAHDVHHGTASQFNLALEADGTRWGWMAGGGIEVALGGNWSAKGEYNFMDFGKKAFTFTGTSTVPNQIIDQQIHVAKFGINYRFGR
jgi:outer membrane immunogenic protein